MSGPTVILPAATLAALEAPLFDAIKRLAVCRAPAARDLAEKLQESWIAVAQEVTRHRTLVALWGPTAEPPADTAVEVDPTEYLEERPR